MRVISILTACVILKLSCTDIGIGPEVRHFSFALQYGQGFRNEVNSFNNTVTKDLVMDGTATTRLVLSSSDLDSIQARLLSIDIFDYPDSIVARGSDTTGSSGPNIAYSLQLVLDGRSKSIFLRIPPFLPGPVPTDLLKAFDFIIQLVEARPEWQQLPPARGGYI